MFVVAGCSGPLPNAVPLPLARSSPPVSQSSTPSSRDSIWNGKPAPSTYLHKLLDVTLPELGLALFASKVYCFCRALQFFSKWRRSHREEATHCVVFCVCACLSALGFGFRAGQTGGCKGGSR